MESVDNFEAGTTTEIDNQNENRGDGDALYILPISNPSFSRTEMVSSELPEEILIDIFSRLPAKSVGQCRCLSKPWRHILSSSEFIKSHLNQKTHQENLILIPHSDGYFIHTIFTIKNDTVSRKRQLLHDWVKLVGCCDGLVLLKNYDRETLLVNPVTLEEMKIPNSPLDSPDNMDLCAHGFGYDSSIDDYKIVKLFDSEHSSETDDSVETLVDVYYVKRGVWKRRSPNVHGNPGLQSGAIVSGALHWFIFGRTGYQPVIAAFNLADEVFTEIPIPAGASDVSFNFWKVAVLGGCLCIFDARTELRPQNHDPLHFWIMKEYGSAESWINFSINAPGLTILKPLCFIKDEELVLVIREANARRLVIHNLKEETLRDMIVDGVPARFFKDGSTFTESLVSPHFT